MPFYPGDWKRDIGVQALEFFDRHVWFEMLLLMWESEERGALILNGSPMSLETIARLVGLDKQTFEISLSKIKANRVCDVREDGAIVCRRMVKDEEVSTKRVISGSRGGNPVLLNQNVSTQQKIAYPNAEDEDENENEDSSSLDGEGPGGETQPSGLTQVTPHCWASSIDIDQWQCSKGKQFLDRCFEKLNGWIEQSRGDPLVFQERKKIGREGVSGAFQSWVFREIAKEQAEAEIVEKRKTGGGRKTQFDRNMEQLQANLQRDEL